MRPDHFLFFFSTLGVFNAFLLALYLLFGQKEKTRADYYLLGLLLVLILRVGVSCSYYFQGSIPWSIVELGMFANLMIGPFLLAYLVNLLPVPVSWRKRCEGFVVVQLMALLLLGAFYPFADHVLVWDHQLRYFFHALLTVYLALALRLLWRFVSTDRVINRRSRIIYATVVAICIGFAISLYTDYVLGPIFASLIFYASLALLFFGKPIANVRKAPKMDVAQAASICEKSRKAMLEEQGFLQPDFKLRDLARVIGVNSRQVTQALRVHHQKGFAAYLAEFRITAAQELLRSHPELTVEAVAYEVGFNSRSTFFALFKEQTGVTPRAFQKRQEKRPNSTVSDG
ncbi:MAG: helix-turn-helix domain-containing protein [Bacteroidota bacterium]